MTYVDASNFTRDDGPHRSQTVRLALHDTLRDLLPRPGMSIVIDGVTDLVGRPVPVRTVQIMLSSVKPDGWEITSKRQDDALKVWRLS